MPDAKIDPEVEAQKKQEMPESVSIDSNQAVQRGDYLKKVEANKELAKQYGLDSYEDLLKKVSLDGVFAQEVVGNLAAGEKGTAFGLHPDAPQEKNITGRIDRTVDTPVRITANGQTDVKPVVAVN